MISARTARMDDNLGRGPMVRIHFPPAASQERTVRLPSTSVQKRHRLTSALASLLSGGKSMACKSRNSAESRLRAHWRETPPLLSQDAVARILFAQGNQQGWHMPAVTLDD